MGPLKLLRHLEVILLLFFFTEKIKQNYVFSSKTLILIYEKKLEHELNEL